MRHQREWVLRDHLWKWGDQLGRRKVAPVKGGRQPRENGRGLQRKRKGLALVELRKAALLKIQEIVRGESSEVNIIWGNTIVQKLRHSKRRCRVGTALEPVCFAQLLKYLGLFGRSHIAEFRTVVWGMLALTYNAIDLAARKLMNKQISFR